MKRSTVIFTVVFLIIAAIFVALPLPPAALYIRIHFDDIAGDACALYYSTDAPFSYTNDRCIQSSIDKELNQVTFRLDGSLANQILDLRLDFPGDGELIGINNISISSAGVIQKEYHPCAFFDNNNILLSNDATLTLADATNKVYISTTGNDPYIILSNTLTSDIVSHFSQYRLTRICICIFVAIAAVLMKKKFFTDK